MCYKYSIMHLIEFYHDPFFFSEIFFFLSSINLWVNVLGPKQIFLTHLAHAYGMCYVIYKGARARNCIESPSICCPAVQLRQNFISFSPLPVLAPGCSLTSVTRLYFRQKPDRKEKHIVGKCRVFLFSFTLRKVVKKLHLLRI